MRWSNATPSDETWNGLPAGRRGVLAPPACDRDREQFPGIPRVFFVLHPTPGHDVRCGAGLTVHAPSLCILSPGFGLRLTDYLCCGCAAFCSFDWAFLHVWLKLLEAHLSVRPRLPQIVDFRAERAMSFLATVPESDAAGFRADTTDTACAVRDTTSDRSSPSSSSIAATSHGIASRRPSSHGPGIPPGVVKKLLAFVTPESRRSLRLTCKSWRRAIDETEPVARPAANTMPPELLLQIFCMLGPRDFDSARHTCSQWMKVSLHHDLLEGMLKRAGWWSAWKRDCQTTRPALGKGKEEEESTVWKMSRRFATECLLSGSDWTSNAERSGFLMTSLVDFSSLSHETSTAEDQNFELSSVQCPIHDDPTRSAFHVSSCGKYLLVTTGAKIYIYRLLAKKAGDALTCSGDRVEDVDLAPLACIPCHAEVLSAAIDTSTPTFVVAALLNNREGLICDLVPWNPPACENLDASYPQMHHMEPTAIHSIRDLCSAEDPPRTVSICPGRRCIAFGSGGSIELHWVDEKTNRDCRKQFPMSQPAEVLHFLPNQAASSSELRLISSLAGPGTPGCECHRRTTTPPAIKEKEEGPPLHHHLLADVQSFTRWAPEQSGNLTFVRATHCHHYRAIPINDGLHILFVEPRTSLLCIGSDAPIGGPTSLARAIVCVPPSSASSPSTDSPDPAPSVFAVGSDLNWGLRVVAAYNGQIMLYSVPADVFNVIRKEREQQAEGVMGDSDLARDWFLDTNSQRSRKQQRSHFQNTQPDDWEFLLSVRYRPTAMMWPFKVYGRHIGTVDDVVELALLSSHGGVRVWAFGASGDSSIIDVDTFSSPSRPVPAIPCKSVSMNEDGGVASAQMVDRTEASSSSRKKRKRKQDDSHELKFEGQNSAVRRLHHGILNDRGMNDTDALRLRSQANHAAAKRRASSFAACIVDFKIPELGPRGGKWFEGGSC